MEQIQRRSLCTNHINHVKNKQLKCNSILFFHRSISIYGEKESGSKKCSLPKQGRFYNKTRQDKYLNEKRFSEKMSLNFSQNEWYTIFRASEFDTFLKNEIGVYFDQYILPTLERINSIDQVLKLQDYDSKKEGYIWYIDEVIQ